MMTPAKAGRHLAEALPNAHVVALKGAGHMLISERPDEVLDAVRGLAQHMVGDAISAGPRFRPTTT
jgi:pimeloyl-ACP methyl ester carboxylesterase